MRADRRDPNRRRLLENAALRELERVRAPVMEELERIGRRADYNKGRPPHVCCTRAWNQMRISPLEAKAIARAFREDPCLRRKLPQVIDRLEKELEGLDDTSERQSFDCPLLEGTRCLVHHAAKPIGCAAWHPPRPGEDAVFTRKGWRAFAERDRLNDRAYGRGWKLRVIPLWLRRVFAREFALGGRARAGPRPPRPGRPPAGAASDGRGRPRSGPRRG